ncbi:MAG: ShlB/FhaC/HecB family hemolysin secretion/activation protein [Planctomycetota bacterium]
MTLADLGRSRRATRLLIGVLWVMSFVGATSSLSPLCAVTQDADSPSSAAADPSAAEDDAIRVTSVEYVGVSFDRVPRSRLDWERILVTPTPDGYVSAVPGERTEWLELGRLSGSDGTGTALKPSAIQEIPTAVIRAYRRSGLGAVRVVILRSDLDALRHRSGGGVLRVHVREGVIASVGASARTSDGTLTEEATLADLAVQGIVAGSPVVPGDLVEIDRLEEYTAGWNRFPHRRVEAGIAPGPSDGTVSLDYVVTAVRPWSVFLGVDNTGTDETGRYRERLGFQHRNLSGRDDALSFGLVTAEFDESTAIYGSYELPFQRVPFFSARLFGVHSEYDASEVGSFDLDFSGESTRGGLELKSARWRTRALFADFVLAGEVVRQKTENETLAQRASATFGVARAAIILHERRRDRQWQFSLAAEGSVTTFGGADAAEVERLGRTEADRSWRRARAEFRGSSDLFHAGRTSDSTVAPTPHEIAWRVDAQHSLGTRTPPTFTLLAGGFHTVRGYPEAYVSGDRGVVASLEYRFHFHRTLEPGPTWLWAGREFRVRPERAGGRTDWGLLGRVFVDVARIEAHRSLSFERDVTLVGVGLGGELTVARSLRLRVDWGVTARDANNGIDRVGAGVSRLHVAFSWTY